MLLAGLLLGIAARLFDIYFQNLGEIFSQMAIWILLGTGFAIYSPTKKAAMGNIFPFCMGMLAAYYVTAAITHGVYSRTFIIGWTLFALPSPVIAYFAWMAKEPGAFSKSSPQESQLCRSSAASCFLTICAFTILSLTGC